LQIDLLACSVPTHPTYKRAKESPLGRVRNRREVVNNSFQRGCG
jgi:hypothetical protein